MISPLYIEESHKAPNGELAILDRFHNSKFKDSNEMVYHSVRYDVHGKMYLGEVDFIVLFQDIILFLEVKGGEVNYDPKTGKWSKSYGKRKKDPWEQVGDYLFHFRDKFLAKKHTDLFFHQKLKFGYGVMFPDRKKPDSFIKPYKLKFKRGGNSYGDEYLEYNPLLVYSSDDHVEKDGLVNYIERIASYWRNHPVNKSRSGLQNDEFEKIQNLIRREIIFEELPISQILEIENSKIERFSKQQAKVFDLCLRNSKLNYIIQGGPGTGKTVLAVEMAVKMAINDSKVLLICFSNPLARYIKYTINKSVINNILPNTALDNIYIYSLTEYFSKFNIDHNKVLSDKNYFLICLDRVEKDEFKFDYLIVDEGQDIFCEEYISLLNAGKEPEKISGHTYIFMDSRFQILYKNTFDELFYQEEADKASTFVLPLDINCRNSQKFIDQAVLQTGFERMDCLIKQEISVQYVYFTSENNLLLEVDKCVREYQFEEVPLQNIFIIVNNTQGKDLLIGEFDDYTDIASDDFGSNNVRVGLVEEFKGLDNQIIIYVANDFNKDDEVFLSEMYVAFTRSKSRLYVFFPKDSEDTITMFRFNNFDKIKDYD